LKMYNFISCVLLYYINMILVKILVRKIRLY